MSENKNVETVTMTLERYEDMQEKINKMNDLTIGMKKKIKALESLIKKIGIPSQLIDKLSEDIPVTVYYSDNIDRNTKEFQIKFEVDAYEMRRLADDRRL